MNVVPASYFDLTSGAERLSDRELVDITRGLGAAAAVAEAIRLAREVGMVAVDAARQAGVHPETVEAWLRAGAV